MQTNTIPRGKTGWEAGGNTNSSTIHAIWNASEYG